jgi:N-acyl-L-homoserine lactone synthetase
MSYQFIEVSSKEQLEKVFAFRYGILDEKDETRAYLIDCKDGRETDEYDLYSVHFAAFDEVGEIIAYTRLVHHSPIGYPMTNFIHYDTERWHFDPELLGEFSRIFVSPKIRSIEKLKPLFSTLKIIGYTKMVDLNIHYTFGALEKSFFRLLNMLHFPYHRIGDIQQYFGHRYPCILYTDELRSANPELFEENKVL